MRIALRHRDIGMSELLLDELQRGSAHGEMRSPGMSEIVKMEILNPRLSASGIEGFFYIREGFPVGSGEEVLALSLRDPHEKVDHIVIQKLVACLVPLLLLLIGEQAGFQVDLIPF